eukprot:m.277818 g.277818  ORF g.277818 m.277818 type:complete len:1140 (+) comp17713_c0_seq1:3063-6482(+)
MVCHIHVYSPDMPLPQLNQLDRIVPDAPLESELSDELHDWHQQVLAASQELLVTPSVGVTITDDDMHRSVDHINETPSRRNSVLRSRGRLGSADRTSALASLTADANSRRLSLSQHDLAATIESQTLTSKAGSIDNLLASQAPGYADADPPPVSDKSSQVSSEASLSNVASSLQATNGGSGRPYTPDARLTLAHLQCELSTALRAIVLDESETAIRQIALQSIYIQVVGELRQPTPVGRDVKPLHRAGLEVLLSVLRLPDLQVVITATYLTGLLTEHMDEIVRHCPDMVGNIVVALARAAGYFLPDGNKQSPDPMEAAVPDLLEAIRDWLIAIGDDVGLYRDQVQNALDVLDAATKGTKTELVQELSRYMIDLPPEDDATSPTPERSLNLAGIDELASFCIQPEGHGFGVGGPGPAMSESSLNMPRPAEEHRRSGRRRHRGSRRNKAEPSGTGTPTTPNQGDESPSTPQQPVVDIAFDRKHIVIMARSVQAQVVHHLNSYPPVAGGSLISSTVSDWCTSAAENAQLLTDPHVQFFAYENDVILSMTERNDGGRVILRNLAGKFAWDFVVGASQSRQMATLVPRRSTMSLHKPKGFRDPLETQPGTRNNSDSEGSGLNTGRASPNLPMATEDDEVFLTVPTVGVDTVPLRTTKRRDRGQRLSINIPQLSSSSKNLDQCIDLPVLDMSETVNTSKALATMLDYLDASDALSLAPSNSMSSESSMMEPSTPHSPVRAPSQLDEGALLVMEARKDHQQRVDDAISNSIISYAQEPEARTSTPMLPVKNTSFSNCRRWLEHLGLITWSTQGGLQPLDKSDKLIRELKNLDQSGMTREKHKIAVIYIGERHKTKEEIVGCVRGSVLFETFASQLGWMVDLESHEGYSGKLDVKEFAGVKLPYYATASREALFHVTTSLVPASMAATMDDGVAAWDAETQKALYGKRWRHAGNDAVHIIWSEQEKLYSPELLPTKFGDVSIVIYPMTNGLFRIQMRFKSALPRLVGPLFDGAVVDAASLPHLVRATAFNADRMLRLQKSPAPFLQTRSDYMCKLIADLSIAATFEQFVSSLLVAPDDSISSTTPEVAEFRARSPTMAVPRVTKRPEPRRKRSSSIGAIAETSPDGEESDEPAVRPSLARESAVSDA